MESLVSLLFAQQSAACAYPILIFVIVWMTLINKQLLSSKD